MNENINLKTKILLVIGIVFAIGFLFGLYIDSYWIRLVTKPVPILSMIFWLWRPPDLYSIFIITGLGLSMIGDVLLSASPTLFLIGLVIFLLAHIAYSLAFISDTKILRIYSGIPFLIYGIAIYAYLFPALNNMVIAVGIYIIVICTMMWRSAARIHQGMSVVSSEWIGFAGAVLFALSDTILAVDRFNLDVPNAAYIIIVIYWLGQLGITYSAKYR